MSDAIHEDNETWESDSLSEIDTSLWIRFDRKSPFTRVLHSRQVILDNVVLCLCEAGVRGQDLVQRCVLLYLLAGDIIPPFFLNLYSIQYCNGNKHVQLNKRDKRSLCFELIVWGGGGIYIIYLINDKVCTTMRLYMK